MDFGLHLPNAGLVPEGPGIIRVAQAAEAAGFHSVWLFDHLFTPSQLESKYPYTADGSYLLTAALPFADPVAVMGAIAGGTTTIRFGTRVLIPAYRHPVVLAKELATIDVIAGGRMILGVGAGWMAEEFDAVDVPMEGRFARMDEHIELMRACWSRGITAHSGRYYSHVEAGFGPQPPGPGSTIPIIIGGHGDAALRRAARYGDGWAVSAKGDALLTSGFDAVAERLDTLRRFCDEEGRSFDDLMLVSQCTPDDSVDSLKRQADLGIDIVDLMIFGTEEQVIEAGKRFLGEVVAKLP
ncbi:MAG: TIGR03619 family F420-dependent LLM class oxidoreductase [Acidimicrobiales bacterium]